MAVVHDLVIGPQARPLSGSVPLPSDPRIAELSLLCAALAEGESEIRWLSQGRDVETMVAALRSLGVAIQADAHLARVRGVGLSGLRAAQGAIDCGKAASVLAALTGVLVERPFETVLSGDEVPGELDLAGLAGALRRRGAQIEGRFSTTHAGHIMLPLFVGPLPPRLLLSEVEHHLVGAHPDIKCALLFSGLYADGPTYVHERVVSLDHVVRLLDALEVPIAAAGSVIELDPARWSAKIPSFSSEIPGDFSAAMLFLAAASLVKGSRVCTRGAGLNPTRNGALDLLRAMGGAVDVEVHAVVHGEPVGTMCASFAPLRAVSAAGEVLSRSSQDIAVLVALAARSLGRSEIQLGLDSSAAGRATLDLLEAVVREFGVSIGRVEDGIAIEGRPDGRLAAVDVDARGNADAAAAAVLLALVADGPTTVRRIDGLALRFPRFVGTLRALGVEARVEQRTVEQRRE